MGGGVVIGREGHCSIPSVDWERGRWVKNAWYISACWQYSRRNCSKTRDQRIQVGLFGTFSVDERKWREKFHHNPMMDVSLALVEIICFMFCVNTNLIL